MLSAKHLLESNVRKLKWIDENAFNKFFTLNYNILSINCDDIDLSKYTTKDYVDYQIENHTHPKVTNEDIEQIMNDIF